MKHIIFSFFLVLGFQVAAQDFITIEGRILDVETQAPLPFASLTLLPTGTGSLSNEEGEFTLNIPISSREDSLFVNLLGYGTFRRKVSQVPQDQYVEIALIPKSYVLEEIVITPEDPTELIKKAVDRVRENHPYYPRKQQVFYREAVSFNDSTYDLLETVANTFVSFPPDSENAVTRIQTLKARKISNRSPQDTLMTASFGGGGLHDLLEREPHDTSLGGNSEIQLKSFLNPKEFKFYRYEIEEITEYQGRLVYVISFDQDKAFGGKLYQGNIYLDVQTLGFAKLSFRFSQLGKRFRLARAAGMKYGFMKGLLRLGGFQFDLLQHASEIHFQYAEGVWVPNYVQNRFHIWFKVPKWIVKMGAKDMEEEEMGMSKEDFISMFTNPWNIRLEHDMLGISKSQKYLSGIPSGNGWTDSDPIGEEDFDNDENFWAQYNFIKPSSTIRRMEQKIRQSKVQ